MDDSPVVVAHAGREGNVVATLYASDNRGRPARMLSAVSAKNACTASAVAGITEPGYLSSWPNRVSTGRVQPAHIYEPEPVSSGALSMPIPSTLFHGLDKARRWHRHSCSPVDMVISPASGAQSGCLDATPAIPCFTQGGRRGRSVQ